jgi:hypothetical protein
MNSETESDRQLAEEDAFVEEQIGTDDTQAGGVMSVEELAAVREVVLRAYPETVPEMVGGESVAALLQSIEPAAAAYQRIAAGVATRAPAPAAPTVPAGSAPPVSVDPERLPSVEKIRRGLATKR